MCNVFGCFIIRNEGNGCLTSVYHEHNSARPFTESCILLNAPNTTDPFIGEFSTVWLEPENRTANLLISRNNLIYSLEWRNVSSSTSLQYVGCAFLSEGKLVGSYWLENS